MNMIIVADLIKKLGFASLKKESPPGRYELFFRGNLLVFAGYIIATIETLLAIKFGLTDLSYKNTFFISSIVLLITIILTLITRITKIRLVWYELIIFIIYLVTFLGTFCVWVYWLGELRFLGILNGLTAVTIVLSYTNAVQSGIMSVSTLVCYYSVVWYSMKIAGQPGSFARETFFAFCLIPAFVLISVTAYYMNRQRKEIQKASSDLAELNSYLQYANEVLQGKQKLIDIEMELASEIQKAIFPSKNPETLDWDVSFILKPYSAVSGDFFDVYHNNGYLKGISLFDVSGHGIAPGLITILAKPVLYSLFINAIDGKLGDVLKKANVGLMDELEAVDLYITGIMLKINGDQVEYVNAGHPDLIHYRASEAKVDIISDNLCLYKGHPIGISILRDDYRSLKINAVSGDFFILYSDGLIESRNSEREEFGRDRLVDLIKFSRSKSSEELLNIILESHEIFTGGKKSNDDITVIVARRL